MNSGTLRYRQQRVWWHHQNHPCPICKQPNLTTGSRVGSSDRQFRTGQAVWGGEIKEVVRAHYQAFVSRPIPESSAETGKSRFILPHPPRDSSTSSFPYNWCVEYVLLLVLNTSAVCPGPILLASIADSTGVSSWLRLGMQKRCQLVVRSIAQFFRIRFPRIP